ncbi:MAG: hypothetical protein PHZ19_03160 [Candidatus Thermoplasmatota archaeon]|nr:hypothetical protein [Candidatus Thermoplasmatota archaeon]
MDGEMVYFFLYDVGAFLQLENIDSIDQALSGELKVENLESTRAMPRYVKFPYYLSYKLEEKELRTSHGSLLVNINLKLFPIGVVSYEVHVPFSGQHLGTLSSFYWLSLENGESSQGLDAYIEGVHHTVLEAIKPNMVNLYEVRVEPETQTVFCLTRVNRRERQALTMQAIAALLSNERESDRISPQLVEEKTQYRYSYYSDDLLVIDWDAALILEPFGQYDSILLTLELANLQLLELRTYDKYLDRALTKAYEDIQRFFATRNRLKSPRKIIKELAETKLDFAPVTDYIVNITKFFGDWYLGRIYTLASERFHLSQWQGIVSQKIDMLNSLYSMLNLEATNNRLLILEFLVVLLFIIDVILIFFSL